MQAQKKIPPKPQSLKKKQQRDAKLRDALVKLRTQRRQANKLKRAQLLKKAQNYQNQYRTAQQAQIAAYRHAKANGQIHVPAQPKVAFVIRIRGINKLHPRIIRIFRLLRLRQLHNGVFVRVNKASANMIRRVEPYVAFGYPSRQTIKKLIYKRGYGKIQKQRIPLSNNKLIEESLGKYGIICVEDLINEIYTVGPHFKEANNFIWPFKLRAPRGGFSQKRNSFQRRGDWGNRDYLINLLACKML